MERKEREMRKYEEMTMADKLHEGTSIKMEIEDIICDLMIEEGFEDYDFEIWDDDYDNSLEILFKFDIPYPWEPGLEMRQKLFDLGFDIIFYNFEDGDEIRDFKNNNEPRRTTDFEKTQNGNIIEHGHILIEDIGYVDDRFKLEEWKYNFRGKIK